MARDNEITEEEVLRIINQMVSKWRTKKEVAKQLGISNAYLSDILNGNRDVSDRVARRLGYTKVVRYKKEE